jgi:hypothetical protein
MLCHGILQEMNQEKKCWLPANQQSHDGLCRRCHFLKMTSLLDRLTQDYERGELQPIHEEDLQDPMVQKELLHPAREQALLNLLSSLFRKNKIQFSRLVSSLEHQTAFSILVKKRIEPHTPGTRCPMYRVFLKRKSLYQWRNLCWGCWPCIAWSLKQQDKDFLDLYIHNFGREVFQLTEATVLQMGSKVFVDLLVSLYLLGHHHHIRSVVDHMLRGFHTETTKSLLLLFFQQPALLSLFFEGKEGDFLPLPFRDQRSDFKQKIKQSIKARTNLYKEELIQRTWHPSRLFDWCFDLEELKDFSD